MSSGILRASCIICCPSYACGVPKPIAPQLVLTRARPTPRLREPKLLNVQKVRINGGRDESCGDHTVETRDPISVPPIPNAVPGRYVRSARGVECILARAPGAMMEKSREIAVWLHDDQARLIVGAAPANKSSRWAIRGTIVGKM